MPKENGVTFYFVRHGETYFNVLGRMQGWSNALVTEEGKEVVRESGRGLADVNFDAVYTSDLQRTIETADLLIRENFHLDRDTKIQPMKEFREVHFGSFEGLEADKVWSKANEAVELEHGLPKGKEKNIVDLMNAMKKLDPRGWAENYTEFWQRVESGLLTLLNRHAGTGDNILVVSHGMTIRNLIHGLVADFDPVEPLANASVSIVKYINGQFELIAYNQTDHFKQLVEKTENA